MTDLEIMEQALDALEEINKLSIGENAICLPAEIDGAMDALRERLAQPAQEPVCAHGIGKTKCSFCHQPQPEQEPVAHTLNCVCGAVWDVSPDGVEEMVHAPNPPQRKPLTDEEIDAEWRELDGEASALFKHVIRKFARAVEAKLKEKNT